MAEYRVIPGPVDIVGSQCLGAFGSVSTKDLEGAAVTFNKIIDHQATEGWKFLCFDTTSVHSACCMILSKRETQIKLLVFVRE